MNKKINISRIFAFGLVLAGLSGCFDSGSNPNGDSGTPGSTLTVSGRIDLSNAASASVRVAVRGVVGIPDASGKYSISVPAFATRSFDDGSVIDTARIIVDGDTLREVPLTSWSTVLPTNYVVQRNIGVTVGNTTDVLEAVWWTSDSIANTIQLGKDGINRSGFIYTVYDDSMYARDAHLYWLFVRVKTSGANNANGADSILKYSDVHDVTAKSGDQSFDASKFEANTRIKTLGYSLVPQDSSVRVYAMTRTVVMVLDSIVKLDTIASDASSEFTWYISGKTLSAFDGSVDSGTFVNAQGLRRSALPVSGDTVEHKFTVSSTRVSFVAQDTGKWSMMNNLDYRPQTLNVKAGLNDTTFKSESAIGQPDGKFLASTNVTELKFVFVIMEKIKFYRRS